MCDADINNNLGNEQKPDDNDRRPFSLRMELIEWFEAVACALVAVVLLFTFVFRIVGVQGESMIPTLQNEDRVIISHLMYTPAQGDIIVITQPSSVNRPIIKRIIATENQTVDIDFDKGTVTVDGKILDEPYILEPATRRDADDMEFPVTVPEGKVFAMGDNRNNSYDSRKTGLGFIDERYILGKAVWRIFPFGSFGGLY